MAEIKFVETGNMTVQKNIKFVMLVYNLDEGSDRKYMIYEAIGI